MALSVLTIENLVKAYPGERGPPAVRGISFELRKGEVLGLLGPNGAGKTTTIRLLLSILSPTSGRITYFGKDFVHHRAESLQKVGYASTYTGLPSFLTVEQNLKLQAGLYGISRADRDRNTQRLLEFFSLTPFLKRRFMELSAGQKTRVMLVKAFLCDPEIVLLDEPTASLDPDVAEQVRAFIEIQKRTTGVSILLTSHNMEEVGRLCDRVIFLKDGSIVAEDTPRNLARQAKFSEIQIGGISAGAADAERFLRAATQEYTLTDAGLKFNADEGALCTLLGGLAQAGLVYETIAIHHPSLENFFLKISGSSNKEGGAP
jgi:ABC-2 type transport system ATP-binding protein